MLILLRLIWVLDILNLPFMEFLDTTMPINTVAWIIIWLVMPSTTKYIKVKSEE